MKKMIEPVIYWRDIMLDAFLNYFGENIKLNPTGSLYEDFINQLGGKSFGNGLFRSFSNENIEKWTTIVTEAYPEAQGQFKLFGFDWLGRCFGVSLRKNESEKIFMFEIGTGEVLGIPCSLENFLNEEIPLYADDCLAASFFDEWMTVNEEAIAYENCVGYIVPLFLGGDDEIDNLEETDMEVYWGITAQIVNVVEDYPDGTEFGEFTIE